MGISPLLVPSCRFYLPSRLALLKDSCCYLCDGEVQLEPIQSCPWLLFPDLLLSGPVPLTTLQTHQREATQTVRLMSLHFPLQQHLQVQAYSVVLKANYHLLSTIALLKTLLSFFPSQQVSFLLLSAPLPRPLIRQMSHLENSTACRAFLKEFPFSPGLRPSCPSCFEALQCF